MSQKLLFINEERKLWGLVFSESNNGIQYGLKFHLLRSLIQKAESAIKLSYQCLISKL